MKTHNLSHKYELTPGLHYKVATDSESYPNLAPSSETQLGELAAVDGSIYNPPTPHRSPALEPVSLQPLKREPRVTT